MAKTDSNPPEPEKGIKMSTTGASRGEIRGRGRTLLVLVGSLALALVAMAAFLTYFYRLP